MLPNVTHTNTQQVGADLGIAGDVVHGAAVHGKSSHAARLIRNKHRLFARPDVVPVYAPVGYVPQHRALCRSIAANPHDTDMSRPHRMPQTSSWPSKHACAGGPGPIRGSLTLHSISTVPVAQRVRNAVHWARVASSVSLGVGHLQGAGMMAPAL